MTIFLLLCIAVELGALIYLQVRQLRPQPQVSASPRGLMDMPPPETTRAGQLAFRERMAARGIQEP